MTIFVNLFIEVSQKISAVTLNTTFSVVGTYEPYCTIFPLHLDDFFLIHTRIWWANNLRRNPPLVICKYEFWSITSVALRAGLHHGRWHFSMVWLDGPTSMVWFLKKSIYKAFGPLTRCKSNVDQEEWPCIKMWMCWLFLIYARKGQFCQKFKFDHSLVFSWALLVFTSF